VTQSWKIFHYSKKLSLKILKYLVISKFFRKFAQYNSILQQKYHKTEMNWIAFREQFFELGCVNIHQIYAWYPSFQQNNLARWTRLNYLIKLRNGYYAFPDYLKVANFETYIASQIYRPSYISLHSALAFYGIIPESVIQITSVSSLKTAFFKNTFGEYSYKAVRSELMFGYENKPLADGRSVPFATPEKALLDLLYLYPFYNNEQELEELRLDHDFLQSDLNVSKLMTDLEKFENNALEKRVILLKKVYEL